MADVTKTPPAPKPDVPARGAREQYAAELAADPFWQAEKNPVPGEVWISGRPPVKPTTEPPADGATR
jgi:hypothetical protein